MLARLVPQYEHNGTWVDVPKPWPLAIAIRGLLLNALAYTDGHQGRAARLLGITQRKLSYQLQRHHIPGAGVGSPGYGPGKSTGKTRKMIPRASDP